MCKGERVPINVVVVVMMMSTPMMPHVIDVTLAVAFLSASQGLVARVRRYRYRHRRRRRHLSSQWQRWPATCCMRSWCGRRAQH